MEDLDYRHLPWLIHFDPSHNRRGFQHEDYTTTKEGKLIHGLNENNRKKKRGIYLVRKFGFLTANR